MKKKFPWTIILIILGIATIVMVSILIQKPNNSTNQELVKCIGKNSILYTQLGCHACETQEQIFGENYQYLNVIDCFFQVENCQEIIATPTWKIKGEFYKGVQSIEELKELTGC